MSGTIRRARMTTGKSVGTKPAPREGGQESGWEKAMSDVNWKEFGSDNSAGNS